MLDASLRRAAVWLRTPAMVCLAVGLMCPVPPAAAQTLQQRLLSESPQQLAAAAMAEGDARRGAVVFHQPAFGCAQCHAVGDDPASDAAPMPGPHLARLQGQPDTDDVSIIRSVLNPSQRIRTGFETVRVLTTSGQVLVGRRMPAEAEARTTAEADGQVSLRELSTQRLIRVPAEQVETILPADVSIMPADAVNGLSGRQQFLDLIKYLFEIRDGGPARAAELQPPPELYALRLPPYESRVDHARLIRSLDDAAMQRGQAIYEALCINCHGTLDQPGSLPTAPRFAEGTLRNGHDPFAMYQTLTHGFGLMVPQTWMVPRQKYDVIHFIRQAFLKPHNASQFQPVTEAYLAALPKGDTLGPKPVESAPWSDMDYGPWMFNTIEVGRDGSNIAYKGIAVRLDPGPGGVARGNQWMLFDHDTMRVAAAWMHDDDAPSRFIDWQGIQLDGRHGRHAHVVGDVLFANPTGPGWANPETGSFADDRRVQGRDGKRYGPLPRTWATYHGLSHAGRAAIVAYRIGDMEVRERFDVLPPETAVSTAESATAASAAVFLRTLHLQPTSQTHALLVATDQQGDRRMQRLERQAVVFTSRAEPSLLTGAAGDATGCRFQHRQDRLCLQIPPSDQPRTILVWTTRAAGDAASSAHVDRQLRDVQRRLQGPLQAPSLGEQVRRNAHPLWPEVVTTEVQRGTVGDAGFAVDQLTVPESNPWLARMRFGGLDFFSDGDRMAVCTWDGDVYEVAGLAHLDSGNPPIRLTWRRIASGLFQPLGLKIVDDVVYLTCRDQIVVLRDVNGDRTTDVYECFNNDHQVTEHFHEFAMGLQRDAQGNWYYAKSARHALPAVVPHHGTLLRVAPDGSRTDILAVGFRAANGICLNEDGSFIVTDQEGHWNPKNRINWVNEGGFYGNMYGYHDVTDASDAAMQQPLCWITNSFDRSPAELLWADSSRWGNLQGSLLNLSYGYGKLYVVPHQHLAGSTPVQGGMCELPIPQFPTGIIRGRFRDHDGQLYVCGLYAWAGSQQAKEGGLYRIRYGGGGACVPTALDAAEHRLRVTFSDPLDPASATDLARFSLKAWDLKRSEQYGSPHVNEREWKITSAALSGDGSVLTLTIPELTATWCYELRCRLVTASGRPVERVIHGTIHTTTP